MEWVIKKEGQVATIKFDVVSKPLDQFIEHHVSLALALEAVRFDDSVRVVVITGRDDGLFELGPMPGEVEPYPHDVMNPATRPGGPSSLRGPWSLTQGVERTFAALAFMEKPVIARLNGNAYGFAMHALWGCDIIIAQEDVLLSDQHLALHPVLPWGMAAGDGAFAFLPLFMTPTKLKEFLLLGPSWTAKEMADMGLINYAVPADQLDAKVNEFVQKFLERPIGALIKTKRAANKRLIEQMNLTLDYSWLSETIDHWEMAATDFKPQLTLRPDEPSWTVADTQAKPGLDPQHNR
jgi:enoyl-CoA hydratase/carnithine racemase